MGSDKLCSLITCLFMGQRTPLPMSAHQKPFDPVAYMRELLNETFIPTLDKRMVRAHLLAEMKRRGIRLKDVNREQLVGLFDYALEAQTRQHKAPGAPSWKPNSNRGRNRPRRRP